MLSWHAIRPELVKVIGDCCEGLQVVWKDQQRPFVETATQAIVLLQVRRSSAHGADERQQTFNSGISIPNPAISLEQTGMRRIVLEIRVESFDQNDDRFAYNAVERIRTSLGFLHVMDRLRALELSVASIGEALDFDGLIQDDRVTSVSMLEVVLNAAATLADPVKIFNIETVNPPVGTFS